MFQSKEVTHLTCYESLERISKKPKDMQSIIIDEVEAIKLQYTLGIPDIHSFEQWQKEHEQWQKEQYAKKNILSFEQFFCC